MKVNYHPILIMIVSISALTTQIFKKRFLKIANQSNLIFEKENKNLYKCLAQCDKMSCRYADYKQNVCKLYKRDVIQSIEFTNESFLFERLIISNEDCLKQQGFWSPNENVCKFCPNQYVKIGNITNICYYFSGQKLSHSQARSLCSNKSGFLVRPKSLYERTLVRSNSNTSDWIWLDSIKQQPNVAFVWGDNTTVQGFDSGEPNNFGNMDQLYLILKGNYIHDIDDDNYYTICQYNLS